MQYNYFHYPNNKYPPYGSVAYFAYRKLNDDKKELLFCLDQIKSQIISCTELYNNIEVAQEKMNWWLKEVNAIKNNTSVSAPQLKKLMQHLDTDILYQNLIDDISYSIENSSNTERDFDKHIQQNFLGIEILKANILSESFNKNDIIKINSNNEVVRHIFCLPKHFYNQIIFDERIKPSMTKEDLKSINSLWLVNNAKIKTQKSLHPLINMNKIHQKMLKKYLKEIDKPFKEAISFSPLSLLFYSI